MRNLGRRGRIASLMTLGIVLAACGAGGTASGEPSSAGGGTVAVTLQEWAVVPDPATVAAGPVTFTITNAGPEDVHEFVVLRTDLDPDALPTDDTGAVVEEGEGIEVIDEVEDLPVGQTQELSVTLEAGTYVLLCNIYSAEEQEAHYAMGMRTAFTVSG